MDEVLKNSLNSSLRPLLDIVFSYWMIIVAIYLSIHIHFSFYLISLSLLLNRMIMLLHLCHEGVHGNLSKNKVINDFIGMYVCGLPLFVFFSRYKRLHLRHHLYLNDEQNDPDYFLSKDFPISKKEILKKVFKNLLSFKTFFNYIRYYSNLDYFFERKGKLKDRNFSIFIATWFIIIFFVFYFNCFLYFLFFYIIPWLIFQQYIAFLGALQHAPIKNDVLISLKSRNITANFFILKVFMPAFINLHGTHHLNPNVPYYKLENETRRRSVEVWKEDIFKALKAITMKDIV